MADDLLQVINSTLEKRSHRANGRKDVNFEFADMASHLMRNPLSVIQTSVRCLQTLDLEPVDRDNLQEKIWQQSQRLTNFANELLNILRLETEGAHVYTAPVSLPPLVERVLAFVRHENPDLNFQMQPTVAPLPPVAADSVKTEMIMLNLLLGAGRRCHPLGGTVTIALIANTAEVVITISDNGRPIPIGPAEDIFQPFYAPGRTQTNIPSTYQLGLYTTRRWVELQRGRIWADSIAGEGSRFSFSLPIWECRS
jgi:signal transduction histidine kinase